LENLILAAAIFGLLIGLAMLSRVFSDTKGDFFLGLVIIILTIELLFSWGYYSGYNNSEGAVPFWKLLNYLIIPPSIWLFIRYNTDDNFKFLKWHYALYIPAVLAYIIEILASLVSISLKEYEVWFWFTDLLPLIGLIYFLGIFWLQYIKHYHIKAFSTGKNNIIQRVKLFLLMSTLTIMAAIWLLFSFIGWSYYEILEYLIILFFFGFAFLHFLEGRNFPALNLETKHKEFPNYNDRENLQLLDTVMNEKKPFLKPSLPLNKLAKEINLPARYVSFLINQYHQKNYKEYINSYRIETFLQKAKSDERNQKTLLGLALESGFSSKSTFNEVFKNQTGKSPSEYLK
jgi:AraC-like DNA-binding protein